MADSGGQGWGNKERQFYTTRAENVALDGSGNLVITAHAEPSPSAYTCWYGECRYTSTRLLAASRREFAFPGGKESGPRSGCSAPTSTVVWPQVARSTSWRHRPGAEYRARTLHGRLSGAGL